MTLNSLKFYNPLLFIKETLFHKKLLQVINILPAIKHPTYKIHVTFNILTNNILA